jgi:hypothetical protein
MAVVCIERGLRRIGRADMVRAPEAAPNAGG